MQGSATMDGSVAFRRNPSCREKLFSHRQCNQSGPSKRGKKPQSLRPSGCWLASKNHRTHHKLTRPRPNGAAHYVRLSDCAAPPGAAASTDGHSLTHSLPVHPSIHLLIHPAIHSRPRARRGRRTNERRAVHKRPTRPGRPRTPPALRTERAVM